MFCVTFRDISNPHKISASLISCSSIFLRDENILPLPFWQATVLPKLIFPYHYIRGPRRYLALQATEVQSQDVGDLACPPSCLLLYPALQVAKKVANV